MDDKLKLCMFCGKDESAGPMNMEHFVPKALWDGNRPIHTKTVPAHKSCNESFSDDNDYFRDVLVMEEGAKFHPEVQKLQKGKIARKFDERFGSIVKTLKNIGPVPVTTASGIYIGHSPAFEVDVERMNRVLRNVMKGIFCTVHGEPLPSEWQFQIYSADAIDLTPLKPLVENMSPWCTFGDDVFRCRYLFDKKGAMLCAMQFYMHRAWMGWAMSETFFRAGIEHAYRSMLINPSN